MKRLTISDMENMTADQLRKQRSWRQAALAAGAVDPKQMADISREVYNIDNVLYQRGEKSW